MKQGFERTVDGRVGGDAHHRPDNIFSLSKFHALREHELLERGRDHGCVDISVFPYLRQPPVYNIRE